MSDTYWDKQERFHRALAKIKSNSTTTTTTIPSYREVVDKLEELERENELLGRRYDELTKLIRKQGKDNVDCGDRFLRNYAKDYD
jgi:methanogenic corrinoid protein MtbC1